jgi:hypothetical protein
MKLVMSHVLLLHGHGMNIFNNILGGITKMNGAIGGINQGVRLPQPQVVNLDDILKTIPKTQQYQSFDPQTPIFDDINEYVTPNQTSEEAFNVVSPRTRACNLFSTRSKLSRSENNQVYMIF